MNHGMSQKSMMEKSTTSLRPRTGRTAKSALAVFSGLALSLAMVACDSNTVASDSEAASENTMSTAAAQTPPNVAGLQTLINNVSHNILIDQGKLANDKKLLQQLLSQCRGFCHG